MLKALPSILGRFPATRVVCVGDGSLREELTQQVATLGLQECVRFVGFQPNVEDWLALATATVLPSFYEGLPLAAIESLAAGKPMLASAVDGTPEVVRHGVTGFVFRAGGFEELAEAACRILRRPELGRTMGQAGRRWVLEHFSLKQQIDKTQALYCKAWEQRMHRKPLRALNGSGERQTSCEVSG